MSWLSRIFSKRARTDGMGRSTAHARIGLGALGERISVKALKGDGYRILERNVRVRSGEADIVCLAPGDKTIVIVEVRSRTVTNEARARIRPEDTVHGSKRDKLVRIAREIRKARAWEDRPIRIDVIGVDFTEDRTLIEIRHIQAAVKGWI